MELNVFKVVITLVVTSLIHSPLEANVFMSKTYEQHCDLGLGTPLSARIIQVKKVPTVIECLQACREASSCRSVDVDNSTAGTLKCILLNNNDGSSCYHNSSVTHYRQVSTSYLSNVGWYKETNILIYLVRLLISGNGEARAQYQPLMQINSNIGGLAILYLLYLSSDLLRNYQY